ncbi:protocatechuate 3,4-dioxygenase beta subunit [Agromyces cerinus]|uniref:carboxypeptidase regulatory-like domain-containing protein n=1 Tax=Agromyces cerinus TaxID=33878 RepID=UPI001959C03F|nr:carboxypeptidase regulatory-like domain-containing protein [Agromyces cerinus]MBM7830062.1 protocatechuate 3,4-dioxygenase beta subunit [Agromyces cerinus]
MPRRRSPLPAFRSTASLVLSAIIAISLAVSGTSPAFAEEPPPAAPVVETPAPVVETPTPVEQPDEPGDSDITPGASVEGSVSAADGSAVGDASVNAYRLNGESFEYVAGVLTAGDGSYAVEALPAGTYTLQFGPPWESDLVGEWWDDKPDEWSADQFEVVDGATLSGIDAQLATGDVSPEGGTVSGVVTGSDAQPLAGVGVSAMSADWNNWSSAVTDADGRYEITGLAVGDYTISFQPDAFDPSVVSGFLAEYWADKRLSYEADLVTVGPDEAVAGIDAQLERGGTITGVVAADGGPIAGVEVSAVGSGWGSATTDEAGRFEMTGLVPGTYSVWFAMPSGSPYFSGGAEVDVTSGGIAELDFVPEGAASVHGRVSLADSGAGVAGATVTLHALGGASVGTATTDADGDYVIAPIAAGRYLLEVSGAGIGTTWSGGSPDRSGAQSFQVAAAHETTVDVAARHGGSGVIEGTVSSMTNDGVVPADGAYVELHTERGMVRSAITDATGGYRFEELEAGSYAVRFAQHEWSSTSWWSDGATSDAALFFDLDATGTATHDFTLPGFGWITAALPVDGAYTGYLHMEAVDAVTGEVVARGSSFDGNEYTLFDVPAGDVKVRYSGPIRDSWWGGADFASAQTISVPIGGEARADATLSLDTVLSGIVTAPDEQPVAGASVYIRPDDGSSGSYYASTDDTGVYRVTGLEPGRYTVSAQSIGASAHEPAVVEIAFDVAAVTRDIRLSQDVKLAGTITLQGQPVEGCLTARILGAQGADGDCTDASGSYEHWLAPGEYDVSFRTTADLGAAGLSHRVTIAPNQSGTLELNSDLEPGGVVEGTVTADLGAGSEPIEGVWVTAVGDAGPAASAVSGVDGTYRFTGLQNGVRYTVRFGDVWSDLGMEWWDGAPTPDSATAVVLGAEPMTGVDAELTRGGAVSGRITDVDGRGASFTTVEVYSPSGDLLGKQQANIHGAYLLTGLAAGDVTLRFVPSQQWAPGYLPEWWNDAGSVATAEVVAVTAGEEASRLDAVLNEVGTVAVELGAAEIHGVPKVGETLEAAATVTTDGASLAFEWLADDAVVAGATGAALTLTADLVGKRMSVRVTASADGYLPTTLTSPQTDSVAGTEPDPDLPRITGTPVVGAKLEADPGEKVRGTAFAYQWYADGSPIDGATDPTLRPTSAHEGTRIEVRVTTLRRGVVLERRTSTPTLRVLLADVPTVSGSAIAGSTLTADPGAWTAETEHTYQWYAGGEAIEGATGATLELTFGLAGTRIRVGVSGHLPGYPVVERRSEWIQVVRG